MTKSDHMAELKVEAEIIRERVCGPGTSLVLGEGDLDARLALVGEAPGGLEDKLGRPFVGPSGRFLDRELQLAGIDRARTFITGVVKCRPVRPGSSANRAPTKIEIDAWRGILLRQLEVVSPYAVLCFGKTAASVLIHPNFSVTQERGIWFDGPNGVRAMATFHPAYLMRFAVADDDPRLRAFRADLRAVVDAIA